MNEPTVPTPNQSQGCLVKIAGVALVVFLTGLVLLSINRGKYPPLDRPEFEAARKLWAQNGPADYNIEIQVLGRQEATYSAEVRNGEVQSAKRNGTPLKQRRTFDTWSVPGMFETIGRDVENLEKVKSGRADASTPRLRLRCKFDEKYGYPLRYLREESSGVGDNPEVIWEVKKFEVLIK
jgi:hypothetical protein